MFYTRQTGSLSYFVQWSHEDDLVDKKEEEDKTPPPLGNGGKTDLYIWT